MDNNNNFFSLDKLVEFGLGMAMARQMIDTMNHSINAVNVVGVNSMGPATASSQIFFVVIDGNSIGPLAQGDIVSLINDSKIDKNTLAWIPGMSGWKSIESVPEILKLVALCPPKLK